MRLATHLVLAALLWVVATDLTFAQGRGRGGAGGGGGFGGSGMGGGSFGPSGGSFGSGGGLSDRGSSNFGGNSFGDRPTMSDGGGHSFGSDRSEAFGGTPNAVSRTRPLNDPALDRSQSNPERIRDHREDVADQLRTNAEHNGNDRLYGAADRMDGSAQQNYERQSGAAPTGGQNANAVAHRPEWTTNPEAARAQAAERPAETSRRWRPGSGLRRLWPFGGRG